MKLNQFDHFAKKKGVQIVNGQWRVPAEKVIEILNFLDRESVKIDGVEALFISRISTRPDMNMSLEFSDLDREDVTNKLLKIINSANYCKKSTEYLYFELLAGD